MNVYFITFRSVTMAQRGEGSLKRKGIWCSLQRTPRWMEEQGCGYCLRLRAVDAAQALQQLRREQIQFRKVYLQREDGTIEGVAL